MSKDKKTNINYDALFCRCGRVHFLDRNRIDDICDNGKEVIIICNHCGNTIKKGLTDYIDGGKAWYSIDIKDEEITDFSNIGLMIASSGDMIRMMSGHEASCIHGSCFIDYESEKPEDVSEEEWNKRCMTVDTKATINWINDDDKLRALSRYGVKINWVGTKYERK